MTWLEKMQARRQRRIEKRKALDEKLARGFEKNIRLEKGDMAAILIAGMINFVLPIMLVITGICLLTYYVFTGGLL